MGLSGDIRVLHVDDEESFLRLSADLLARTADIEVVTDTSPEEAFDVIGREEVDCIVSDYQMPEMNGIEFCRRVRQEYSDIPFILFTGQGTEDIASEAITAGVDDYMQKGTGNDQYEVLANRISNLVVRSRAEAAYTEVFDRAPVGMAIHDPETAAIIDANERYCDLLGITESFEDNHAIEEVTVEEPPYTATTALQLVKEAAEGETRRVKWVLDGENGDLPVLVSFRRVEIGGVDRVLACTVNVRDAELIETN